MPLLLFIGIIVVVVVAIAAKRAREELNRSWRAVSQQLGLLQTAANWAVSPKLDGSVSGYPTTIDIEKRGGGNAKVPWTRFGIVIPQLRPDLVLKEEGFLSTISNALGAGDIDVGDAEFDKRFHIKGRDANAIRGYLTPERRTVLQRFFTTHRGARLSDSTLIWATKGKIRNAGQMVATVEDMLTVARVLAEGQAAAELEPAPVEIAPKPESDPDAEFETTPEPAPESEPVPEPVLEPAPEPEPQSAPDPESVAVATADGAVDLDEFCDSVFAAGSLSFQASQMFDSRFKGQRASWTGTLESVEPYNYDFVFGAGKGIRAILAVQQVEGSLTGDGMVRTVLQLPAEAAGLEDRIGDKLAFSGTLTKVDGLMRKVFVANGQAAS